MAFTCTGSLECVRLRLTPLEMTGVRGRVHFDFAVTGLGCQGSALDY